MLNSQFQVLQYCNRQVRKGDGELLHHHLQPHVWIALSEQWCCSSEAHWTRSCQFCLQRACFMTSMIGELCPSARHLRSARKMSFPSQHCSGNKPLAYIGTTCVNSPAEEITIIVFVGCCNELFHILCVAEGTGEVIRCQEAVLVLEAHQQISPLWQRKIAFIWVTKPLSGPEQQAFELIASSLQHIDPELEARVKSCRQNWEFAASVITHLVQLIKASAPVRVQHMIPDAGMMATGMEKLMSFGHESIVSWSHSVLKPYCKVMIDRRDARWIRLCR